MDDFALLSDADRRGVAYALCIGGSVAMGGAVGRFAMLPGLLAGAAAGLAIGLLSCGKLSPALERKLFSKTEALTERELLQALRVVRSETGVRNKADAMALLGLARRELQRAGPSFLPQCSARPGLRQAANRLLARRA